ncbi:MAG: hypothetical protein QOG37_843, partial [Mycobacterium sp.]|nr:hypothetical protein [Mycobacterium sp.]
RSRRHGLEKWKAAILTATFVLFLVGGVLGLSGGARFGGDARFVPAGTCVALAVASVRHSRNHIDPQDGPTDDEESAEATVQPARAG